LCIAVPRVADWFLIRSASFLPLLAIHESSELVSFVFPSMVVTDGSLYPATS